MLQKIQRFGGALFAPAMLFCISGLMVGISTVATTATIMGDLANYGTPWYMVWSVVLRGAWTVFKQLPLLFAVALPIGLAKKQQARCCMEALAAYLTYCYFMSEIVKLSGNNLGLPYPSADGPATGITVIAGIKTLDTGVVGPLIASGIVVAIHDRFYDAKVPDWLGTFSGSTLVYLISFFAMFALAGISAAVLPVFYQLTATARLAISNVGTLGVGLFVFLERALEPIGLHHLLYMSLYYDNLAVNGGIYAAWTNLMPLIAHSTRPLTELAPWAGFTATGWVKLFGLPTIAAAFYSTARPERKAQLKTILVPAIVASVLCGVTEPLEFLFMFTNPGLFVVYAALSACLAMAMNLAGVVGIFSGGLVEMGAFNFIPLVKTHGAAYLTALVIGLLFSLVFFVVFRTIILARDLKTPGRDVAEGAAPTAGPVEPGPGSRDSKAAPADDPDRTLAQRVIGLLGGAANIVGATNCATRLRVEVRDTAVVAPSAAFVTAGAKGAITAGKVVQVVIGVSVPRVKAQFDRLMGLDADGSVGTVQVDAAAATTVHPDRALSADDTAPVRRHGDGSRGERAVCFFDIDGTLAWQDPAKAQELPEDERDLSPYPDDTVAQAIRALVAGGNLAFLCTGRAPSCIHPKLLELPWSGIIGMAGGYATLGGRVVRDVCIDPSLGQRLVPYLEDSGEEVRFEGLNRVVRMSAAAPNAPGYARTAGDALVQLEGYKAYKILMPTPLARRIAADDSLGPRLTVNDLELGVSEISPRSCTKEAGIRAVLDALGSEHGTVYGFGDASNDVALMRAVDIGIAMGNAPDYLKEQADHVTGTVFEDGVVTALEHFSLI